MNQMKKMENKQNRTGNKVAGGQNHKAKEEEEVLRAPGPSRQACSMGRMLRQREEANQEAFKGPRVPGSAGRCAA